MVIIDPTRAPTQRSIKEEKQLAPRRFASLDGVRLGLVSNSKLNADNVLLAIGDLLSQRYELETIIHERKQNFSLPAPDAIVELMMRSADVVIAGVGD